MEAIIGLIGIAISAGCTVVVALITANSAKSRKAEEIQKQAELAEQQRRDKEIKDALQKIDGQIEGINSRIGDLEEEVRKQQQADLDLLEDVRKLSEQNQISGEYIHEVSKLITVLAEGMRDQHLDGNITNAVSAYRAFESNVLNKLMTQAVVDD